MNRTKENSNNAIIGCYIMIVIIVAFYIYLFVTFDMGRDIGAAAVLGCFGFSPFIIGFIVAIKMNKKNIGKIEDSEIFEEKYHESLRGTDKSLALQLGRRYYGSLREDGRVTTYDEQAITNDMNSMTNTVNVVNTLTQKGNNEDSNQKTMYCSKCGKAYVPDVDKKFCDECGNRYL